MDPTDVRGGARLRAALASLGEAHRAEILEALEAMTRPLNVREIERALRVHGKTRSQATVLAGGLKDFRILVFDQPTKEIDDD